MPAQLLSSLKDMPGWAWAVLGLVLVVLAGGALWWWLTHRKTPDSATTTTDKALAALKQAVPQAAVRAALPWVARIGPDLPGLAGIPGMAPDFVEPAAVPKDGAMRWWGVPGGVVIDLPFAAEPFEAALKALVAARPDRPLDAVLLTVPTVALEADPTLAATLRERLMTACRETGMRLPAYLVLDGAEGLAGFPEVALALPEARRTDMLGWSVPVGIAAPYDPAHVTHLFGDHLPEIEAEGDAEVEIAGRTFTVSRKFLRDVEGRRMEGIVAGLRRNVAAGVGGSPPGGAVRIRTSVRRLDHSALTSSLQR